MMPEKPLYALIVCGGKSERMGRDKFLLDYHESEQWKYIYDAVEKLCDEVIVSCNKEQILFFPDHVKVIVDNEKYQGIGPMAAMMGAMDVYPDVNFFVVGCDYPLLTVNELCLLIKMGKDHDKTSAVFNEKSKKFEPLLAFYYADSFELIKGFYNRGDYSLQGVLKELNASQLIMNNDAIISADTAQQYLAFKQILNDKAVKDYQITEILLR
jgi:molybdenum cofactor guanylyltransferase